MTTKTTPSSYGLSKTDVLVSDHEFGTERLVTGYFVYRNNEEDDLIGELWHDGEQFCWRTVDEPIQFGRDRDQDVALRSLAAVVK